MAAELATTEKERLTELEDVVERGIEVFCEVGMALAEIRDSKLYRETHRRFGDYVRERWGFSARRARQLVRAAEVGTTVPITNEAQARAFGPTRDPDLIREIWAHAKRLAAEGGSKTTAALIAEAARIRDAELIRDERAFRMAMSPSGTYRGGGKPVRPTRGTLEAADRAREVSDEIRLVLGPDGPRGTPRASSCTGKRHRGRMATAGAERKWIGAAQRAEDHRQHREAAGVACPPTRPTTAR